MPLLALAKRRCAPLLVSCMLRRDGSHSRLCDAWPTSSDPRRSTSRVSLVLGLLLPVPRRFSADPSPSRRQHPQRGGHAVPTHFEGSHGKHGSLSSTRLENSDVARPSDELGSAGGLRPGSRGATAHAAGHPLGMEVGACREKWGHCTSTKYLQS